MLSQKKKKDQKLQAIALTSVMSKWCAPCIMLRLERSKEPEGWKQLRGRDGRYQLPTSSSNDNAALIEALEMARRQKEQLLARR